MCMTETLKTNTTTHCVDHIVHRLESYIHGLVVSLHEGLAYVHKPLAQRLSSYIVFKVFSPVCVCVCVCVCVRLLLIVTNDIGGDG